MQFDNKYKLLEQAGDIPTTFLYQNNVVVTYQ